MTGNISLDDLFAEARRAHGKERQRKQTEREQRATVEAAHDEERLTIFSNPKNWRATRGLALVHRESRTLLGNFQEWRHTSVADARRLVRSLTPIAVEGVEEVDFGLEGLAPELPKSVRAEVVKRWSGEVVLEAPAVRAPSVELDVSFYEGWTVSARLVDATIFAEDGELLMLPEGTNIFPVMARETKVALRSVL